MLPRNFQKIIFLLSIFLLLTSNFQPITTIKASGLSWWNTSWIYRKKLTFNNTQSNLGVTAINLTNFPVQIKLTSSNFDFTKAQSAGQDIRFIDSDNSTQLEYEIEKWDLGASEAYIWVKVPQIDVESNADYIYMYYGNSSASSASTPTNVWTNSFNGVWHLKEDPSGNVNDSTSTGTTLTTAGPSPLNSSNQVAGQIDGSIKIKNNCTSGGCNGSTGYGYLTANATGSDNYEFAASQDFSASVWVKATEAQTAYYSVVLGNAGSLSPPRQFRLLIDPGTGRIYFQILADGTSGGASGSPLSTTKINDGNWHYVTGTRTGTTLRIYVDGVEEASITVSSNPTLVGAPNPFRLGNDGNNFFQYGGIIDEARISTTARPEAWVAAEYKDGNNLFTSFAAEASPIVTFNNFNTGSFTTDNTPSINFTLTDADSLTVKYQVQIDNNSDFSSPEIDSTSALINQGTFTFTPGSSLADGSYYLRIKGTDSTNLTNGFTVANGGNIAFKIDTIAPTGTIYVGLGTNTGNDHDVYLIFNASDNLSGVKEMIYSENSNFSGANYVSYKSTVIFTLSEGYGRKVIYAKYKDHAGNESSIYSSGVSLQSQTIDPDIENPNNNPVVQPPPPTPDETIKPENNTVSEIAVLLLDENNSPLKNITIKLNGVEAITDESGVAMFKGVSKGENKLTGSINGVNFEQSINVEENNKVYKIVVENTEVKPSSPLISNAALVVLIALASVLALTFLTYKVLKNKSKEAGSIEK